MAETVKTQTRGLRALYNYPISNNTYENGERIMGAREVVRNVSQSITNFFADNTIYASETGQKVIDGTVKAYSLPDKFYTDYLGFFQNLNGAFSDSNPNVKSGGIVFVEDYKIDDMLTYRISCIYDAKFIEPAITATTNEDAVTLTEYTATYNGKVSEFVRDDMGRLVSYAWFIAPIGSTLEDVLEWLDEGMPTPTGETIPPKDTTPPVITTTTTTISTWTTLDNGTKSFADIITECGVSVTDDTDGNITANTRFFIGTTEYQSQDLVDLADIGTQTVILSAKDMSNNQATPVQITITVAS